jgi:putative transposase
MKLFRNKYRVESQRLKYWDYSTPGWYYVTICTKNMKCWFGKIENGKMVLNELGKIVVETWKNIPEHYKKIELDYFVIMPNHMHGIMIINSVETGHAPSLQHYGATLGNVL